MNGYKKDKLHKQIVQLGVKTDTQMAITSGLSVNDKIVAEPTTDMYDGMKI